MSVVSGSNLRSGIGRFAMEHSEYAGAYCTTIIQPKKCASVKQGESFRHTYS